LLFPRSPAFHILVVLFCGIPGTTGAQDFPRISRLQTSDPVFAQHIETIEIGSSSGTFVPLALMEYRPVTGDTFHSVAARLLLPQETLATVNRIASPRLERTDTILLVPNQRGIFLPSDPFTPLETLLYRRLHEKPAFSTIITGTNTENTVTMRFYRDEGFTDTERLVFFRAYLSNPIPGSVITSRFGMRTNPFTGAQSSHTGIDLAAPFGTRVRAAAAGTVVRIDRDQILGLSVYLAHGTGIETRYAHLREAFVSVGESVPAGSVIAAVGSTGYSTGPHLHFEVIVDGIPFDPLHFISVDADS